MSAFNSQRDRDVALLTALAEIIDPQNDNSAFVERVVDEHGRSAGIVGLAENELRPLYDQLRLSKSTVDRGRAARVKAAIDYLEGRRNA